MLNHIALAFLFPAIGMIYYHSGLRLGLSIRFIPAQQYVRVKNGWGLGELSLARCQFCCCCGFC